MSTIDTVILSFYAISFLVSLVLIVLAVIRIITRTE